MHNTATLHINTITVNAEVMISVIYVIKLANIYGN